MIPLEELSIFLPYDLTAYGASNICTIHSMSKEYISFFNGICLQECSYEYFFSGYTLLVHPLSRITEEIEVNGENIIPLVELAKIADCDTSDSNPKFFNDGNIFGVRFNIENDDDDFIYEVFAYDEYNNFGKHKRTYEQKPINSEISHCPNQLQLFQWLSKHHFDIFGWIDKNLAEPIKK